MPKKIILLSDGTGNSAAKFWKTNVWRLYMAVDLSDKNQLVYYQDGVGNSALKPLAILGGAFGWGLKRNVLDLYMFLCRNYEGKEEKEQDPEGKDNDQIYCFGFSRGAFTIRVLLGLISSQGLIRAETEYELRRLAKNAFRHYRRSYYAERLIKKIKVSQGFRNLRDIGIYSFEKLWGLKAYMPKEKGEQLTPNITFVGLWDTVAAYGLPFDELTRFWDGIFPLSAPDRNLWKKVKRACHALALDDDRNSFHPILWNEKNEDKGEKHNIFEERITQVWFAGAHSDVGGGYPDDALSYVSLDWMIDQVERPDLRWAIAYQPASTGLVEREQASVEQPGFQFVKNERQRIKTMANTCGVKHDSRRGFGSVYRYLPRKLETFIDDNDNDVFIDRPKIHESVFDRICRDGKGYAPFVLPKKYAIVTENGNLENVGENDVARLRENLHEKGCEDSKQAEKRVLLQEQVWDLVWMRRVLYFFSLAFAVVLLTFPLHHPATEACEGPDCGLSHVIGGVGFFLPDFVSPWFQSFQSHSGRFLLFAALLVGGIYVQKLLQTKMYDTMNAIWSHRTSDWKPGYLYRLRTHLRYQAFWQGMKMRVLPPVAGVITLVFILAGINHFTFGFMESWGGVCEPTPAPLKQNTPATAIFQTKALCQASGIELTQGKQYRLIMTINDGWKDNEIPADTTGVNLDQGALALYLGLPFRRHWTEPWFRPIARIGETGSDVYILEPQGLEPPGQPANKLMHEFTARRTGELFLYVNDAVLPIPKEWQTFYSNNVGTATVEIIPLYLNPDEQLRANNKSGREVSVLNSSS